MDTPAAEQGAADPHTVHPGLGRAAKTMLLLPDAERTPASEMPLAEYQILFAEYREIWGESPHLVAAEAGMPDDHASSEARSRQESGMVGAYHSAVTRPQAALCLSGGGIRSAAFALGVLQGLARKGVLAEFHYLSTVSGGGYIGGWLSRWMACERDKALASLDRDRLNRVLAEEADARSRVPRAERAAAEAANASERRAAATELRAAQRALADARAAVDAALGEAAPIAVARRVQASLAADHNAEPDPLRRLREITNFLTPKIGATSVDTWTGVVLYVRNVLLNWAVFLPALMLLALVPNIVVRTLDLVEGAAGGLSLIASRLFLFGGLAALLYSLFVACRFLPSHRIRGLRAQAPRSTGLGLKGAAHRPVVRFGVLWACGFTLFLGTVSGFEWAGAVVLEATSDAWGAEWLFRRCASLGCLAAPPIDPGAVTGPFFTRGAGVALPDPRGPLAVWLGLMVMVPSVVAYLGAWFVARREDPGAFGLVNLLCWVLASAFGGALLTLGCLVLWRIDREWQFDVLAAAGPVWVVAACLAQSSLYVGIRRKRPDGDDDREWIARVSAVCLQVTAAWGLVAGAVLLLPRFLWDQQDSLAWSSGAVALASTLFSAFGGGSRLTTVKNALTLRGKAANLAVSVAALIGIAGLLALFSRLQVNLLIGMLDPSQRQPQVWPDLLLPYLLVWGLVPGAAVALLSRRIGVNRFSMHGFYRNRLSRAFLGSSHEGRRPHPFTGFDSDDNLRMADLSMPYPGESLPPAGGTARRVLFPVVNVALNLTKSTRLAWQERKAMSFTITPLACGSAQLQPVTPEHRLKHAQWRDPCFPRRGAYVGAADYGGPAIPDTSFRHAEGTDGPAFLQSPAGITLATAMTLSGAAASPNMGYHSTKATAFLMTLFNVRLGAWLPNPAYPVSDLWKRAEPRFGLVPMANELTGQADERGAYVYLSDGGHFDNLGLYEMIRRRCRLIVVSDAGCDEGCTFEDLGNAIRKIRIDLNVSIAFKTMPIRQRGKVDADTRAFAVGEIAYSANERGLLLYVKPTYVEGLPVDVVAYGEKHPAFPHESTGDQWFSESQFESYRRLGLHIMEGIGGTGPYPGPSALNDFFRDVWGADEADKDAVLGPQGGGGTPDVDSGEGDGV